MKWQLRIVNIFIEYSWHGLESFCFYVYSSHTCVFFCGFPLDVANVATRPRQQQSSRPGTIWLWGDLVFHQVKLWNSKHWTMWFQDFLWADAVVAYLLTFFCEYNIYILSWCVLSFPSKSILLIFSCQEGYYNEVASLLLSGAEGATKLLHCSRALWWS